MKEIKDNSLQYYLLHHSAVLFGTALISRFIKLLVALNLPPSLGLLTVSSFGLIFLIIWAFWCYQNWSDSWSLIERNLLLRHDSDYCNRVNSWIYLNHEEI